MNIACDFCHLVICCNLCANLYPDGFIPTCSPQEKKNLFLHKPLFITNQAINNLALNKAHVKNGQISKSKNIFPILCLFVEPDFFFLGEYPSDTSLHSVIILDSIKAVPLPGLITIPSEVHVWASMAYIHFFTYLRYLLQMHAGAIMKQLLSPGIQSGASGL